jgi:hypothetical protein
VGLLGALLVGIAGGGAAQRKKHLRRSFEILFDGLRSR